MACSLSGLNGIQGCAERVKFFERNQDGGRPAAVIWSGFMIWRNGSNRELSGGGMGRMQDATWIDQSDETAVKEILWFRIRYYQTRLSDSIKEFEQAKAELQKRANNASIYGGQPPTVDELKQVKRLRHKVKVIAKKLEELFEILNPPTEPYIPTEEEKRVTQQNRDEGDKILNSLKTIEI